MILSPNGGIRQDGKNLTNGGVRIQLRDTLNWHPNQGLKLYFQRLYWLFSPYFSPSPPLSRFSPFLYFYSILFHFLRVLPCDLLTKVEKFHYEFPNEKMVSGFIETLTPYLKSIPMEKRVQFMTEYTQEFKNLCEKRTGNAGELLIWDAECLVVLLRKR